MHPFRPGLDATEVNKEEEEEVYQSMLGGVMALMALPPLEEALIGAVSAVGGESEGEGGDAAVEAEAAEEVGAECEQRWHVVKKPERGLLEIKSVRAVANLLNAVAFKKLAAQQSSPRECE